jgi:hypothetical protein
MLLDPIKVDVSLFEMPFSAGGIGIDIDLAYQFGQYCSQEAINKYSIIFINMIYLYIHIYIYIYIYIYICIRLEHDFSNFFDFVPQGPILMIFVRF